MTQEDKELLLKDLSARLLYGVKVQINSDVKKVVGVKNGFVVTKERGLFSTKEYITRIECCIPYLRPMSSMTEEEKREYFSFIGGVRPFDCDFSAYPIEYKFVYEHDINSYTDWLNKHHFDYHGLIEKGLALEAPKGMYK